jgi:hypothetical protein
VTSTTTNALVWRVEPVASWPAGDLLGDEPAKLVPAFDPADLSATERDIRESLREMAGVGDAILCYGGLRTFSPGERVDVFAVHEAMIEDIREDDGAFGEMADVLADDHENGDQQ